MKKGVQLAIALTAGLLVLYFGTLLLGLHFLELDLPVEWTQDFERKDNRGILSSPGHFCAPIATATSHRCKKTNYSSASTTVVVGALHFLGARLVSHLASQQEGEGRKREVRAVASYEAVLRGAAGEELVWYREEQLRTHHGIAVRIANLTNETQVESILFGGHATSLASTTSKWAPSEVIFVPPRLDGGEGEEDGTLNDNLTQSMLELVAILESLRKFSPCTRVTLLSQTHTTPTLLAWMETLELLVATYYNIYHIPVTVVRLPGVIHGPWGREALRMFHETTSKGESSLRELAVSHCWYVKEVVVSIIQLGQDARDCGLVEMEPCSTKMDYLENGDEDIKIHLRKKNLIDLETSIKWAKSYQNERKTKTQDSSSHHDVIFTSYFTSVPDSQRQRHQNPNRFAYMAEFYWSLRALGLRAVVFHDQLDAGFQHRVSSQYPSVSFKAVPSLQNRSTNDARFYAYFDYLREHPEIGRVLLTDISDVRFQHDPFELMSLLGNWLYVGTDIDVFPNMKSMPWIKERISGCFGDSSETEGTIELEMDTVYNAGTIGGNREVILDTLAMILAYLDSTPKNLNCNMPAVNRAVHRHFFRRVYTGFPLNSRFLRRQSSPKGVYIVHK